MDSRDIIQQSLDTIEQNLTDELTLRELCREAGYSPYHFCRLFQSFVGLPPMHYITRRRLLHAAYAMNADASKTEIALRYGFDTYAGFYKAFRREYNCAPSAFFKNRKGEKPYRINLYQEEHIMITQNKMKEILKYWHREEQKITGFFNENTGRKNENAYFIGDDAVLKLTVNPAGISRQIGISDRLRESGIPAASVIRTEDGAQWVQDGEIYYFLMTRLPGSPLKCADVLNNPSIGYTIGEAVGRLHGALKNYRDETLREVNLYADTVSLKSKELLPVEWLGKYQSEFGALSEKLPKQVIHRDVNPSNLLFDGATFCGFLDFALSEVNVRIFDICYAATAILSEAFLDSALSKENWFAVFRNIISGYDSVQKLTPEEKRSIPYVTVSIQLLCIDCFNRLDKYAELAEVNLRMLEWIMESSSQLPFGNVASSIQL